MAGDLSQDNRIGMLQTPLGKDVLVLSRFNGGEGLGELFQYHAEALSEQANIDFNQLLGLNLSIKIKTVDQLERYFNGVLVQARWTGAKNDLFTYELVLMPWLFLLSHTSDCRIFKSMNVSDIIVQVFQDRGFSAYRKDLTASYPTLEYCVQYRESDMHFVCRLMEEYGIYYFFEHTADKHTLVLADSKTSHKPVPGLAPVPYLPLTHAGARRERQQFDHWSTFRGFQSGRFVLNDYDYKKPPANLIADADQSGGYAHGSMEMYDYPGRYVEQGDGQTLAKVRLQADQAKDQRRMAHGAAPSLFPGGTMTLENHFESSENIEYLVRRCSHSYVGQDYRSGGGRGDAYSGSFELASSERPFRSPALTRKPTIQGPQSAKVVADKGNESEEIDVDSEGRICVHFYWDRKNKVSRRVRIAQTWVGARRGALFIPRIGDEVMVMFENGDPDYPVVVSSVYNGANTVSAELPSKKAISGILTKSSKNSDGWNMLLFDDTAGSERVKVRAQKDLVARVQNDERRSVGGDQKEDVTGNVTKTVGGEEKITVSHSYTLTATDKIVLTVGGSTLTIAPSGITLSAPTVAIKADAEASVAAPAVSVTGDGTVTISAAATEIGEAVTIAGELTTPTISWGAATGSPPVPA